MATILVAEDNEINQLLVMEILAAAGHRAHLVANGAEAVDARFAAPPDLVLMDCMMPVLDGLAATRIIRQREAPGARVPIIAVTANAIVGDRERCLEAGMDDYLAKPFPPDALIAIMGRWLPAR